MTTQLHDTSHRVVKRGRVPNLYRWIQPMANKRATWQRMRSNHNDMWLLYASVSCTAAPTLRYTARAIDGLAMSEWMKQTDD